MDGLSPGEFFARMLFAIAVTASVGLGAFFLVRYVATSAG